MKVSSPTGHTQTVCIIDRRDRPLLDSFRGLGAILNLDQHFALIKTRPRGKRGGEEREVLVRAPKPYTSAPPLAMLYLLTEIIRTYVRIYEDASRRLGPAEDLRAFKALETVVEKCVGHAGFVDLSLKIRLGECVEELCSRYRRLWEGVLGEWLGPNAGARRAGRGCSGGWRDLLLLKTLLEASLFIRRFSLLHGRGREGSALDVKSFDLKSGLHRLYAMEEYKEDVMFFLVNHCCYSGVVQYPQLVWYAQVYGVEPPPLSVAAFRPRGLRTKADSRGEGLPMPITTRDQEPYGWHHPWTLERYTRRWDIDSISTAAAIDVYATRIYMNPWNRSMVYTSLFRSFSELGFNDSPLPGCRDPLVLPALHPRDVVEAKVNMVPVPLVTSHPLDPATRFIAEQVLQRLNRLRVPEEDVKNAAHEIYRALERELAEVEAEKMEEVAGAIKGAGYRLGGKGNCVKGVIVEALHPFAAFFLAEEVIERSVADVPSPSRRVNLLYRLMERITGASTFTVAYLLVVEAGSLLGDYEEYMRDGRGEPGHAERRAARTFVVNVEGEARRLDSYNLEKVLKAVLNIDEKPLRDYNCLASISNVNSILWRAVGQ